MPTKKEPQYIKLDIGNPSESEETRMHKILEQIPEGKTIVLTDETFNQPHNKAVVKIIEPKNIPIDPTKILIKLGFKKILQTGNKKPK